MKAIYNATVVAFEPVYDDSHHRVLLYYENGKKLILNENINGFYELIASSTGISVPHCINIAARTIMEKVRNSEIG